VQQVLLVLGEVLCADILYLCELLVILVLHLLSVSRSCRIDAADIVLKVVDLLEQLLLEGFVGRINFFLYVTLVALEHLVDGFHLLDTPLMVELALLVQFLMGKVDFVEHLTLDLRQLRANLADEILASTR